MILKVSTIQRLYVFMRKISQIVLFMEKGRVDDFRTYGYLKSSPAMP